MEAVSLNTAVRILLYAAPAIALGLLRVLSSFSRSTKFMRLIFNHPFELLIAAIGIGAVAYLCSEILPKIMRSKEKHDIEMLSKTSSHELAAEPGVELYYDSAFPFTAYETTKDFISLETGWKYGNQESFDYKTAMPDAEEQPDDENATDFEKQGINRRMLQ